MNEGEDRQVQAERLLIEAVKQRPHLWDETMGEHKNMELARAAWETVGRMFGMSGPKAKGRWKSMRDIYVRYLRRMALKGTQASPKWKHFEAMNFLSDHIKHRRIDLQYPTSVTIGPSLDVQESKHKSSGLQLSEDEEDDTAGTSSKRVTRARKRKRLAPKTESIAPTSQPRLADSGLSQRAGRSGSNLNTVSATVIPILSSVVSAGPRLSASTHISQQHMAVIPVSSIGRVPPSPDVSNTGNRTICTRGEPSFAAGSVEDDADDLFGRAITATLKKMPARMKALSKLRIQQVLYEMEETASGQQSSSDVIYQSGITGPSSTHEQETSSFM